MNIKKTFLKLTAKTYPYGTENELLGFLPKGIKKDLWGNYFYQIGETKTIFACHLDTAAKDQVNVKHIFKGDFIQTDGKSILGADDKAGVTILLWLIEHNIPGTYYFFIGEEVGCVGSGQASKDVERFKHFDRIISFDRRDTCSVITHQSWSRSCSDEFADALIEQIENGGNIQLKKDDGGVYTDSAEFVDVIPECTNLSVGYYSEHTHSEKQDIVFLENLCHALLSVDWESLPTKRDPKKSEYKSYGGYDDEFGYGWASVKNYNGYNKVDPYTFKVNTDTHSFDGFNDGYSNIGYDKQTRRSKKKKKEKEFDSYEAQLEEELVDKFLSDYKSDNFNIEAKKFNYGILKEIYLDDRLTEDELEIVKEQYLDMSNSDDIAFAGHLSALIKK